MDYGQLTDFSPRCTEYARLSAMAQQAGKINSSYDMRMYLQHNAEALMDQERQRAAARLAPCVPCTRPASSVGTMAPDAYVVRCDQVSCTRQPTGAWGGIGDGRAY